MPRGRSYRPPSGAHLPFPWLHSFGIASKSAKGGRRRPLGAASIATGASFFGARVTNDAWVILIPQAMAPPLPPPPPPRLHPSLACLIVLLLHPP
eukprot:9499168-Pyramimonas_sp.AAC.1